MEKTVLTAECDDIRIDSFLAEKLDISRSYAAKLCSDGLVRVCGSVCGKNRRLKEGETVEAELPELTVPDILPEDIPLDVIYEDDDLIVVNKPQGMVVHPANGNCSGTLVNALMFRCRDSLSGINGVARPGIVHRIDKDTAGLLVCAKNDEAHRLLAEQLKERKANRRYIALVCGNVKEGGIVNKPLGRSPSDRKKMAVVQGGKEAVTHYRPLEHFSSGYTLLECVLETGRTHQIRVHMASIGHPICGDKTYGMKNDKIKADGQLLFAKTLGFAHPKSGEYMEFSAPLPCYFEEILNKLRKQAD